MVTRSEDKTNNNNTNNNAEHQHHHYHHDDGRKSLNVHSMFRMMISFSLGFGVALEVCFGTGIQRKIFREREEVPSFSIPPPLQALSSDPDRRTTTTTASLDQYMQDYWNASQITYPHLTVRSFSYNMSECTSSYNDVVDFPKVPDDMFLDQAMTTSNTAATTTIYNNKITTATRRYIAEEFWLQQRGVLYMQHSRKAGGTTLCMTLRLNRNGLIHQYNAEWVFSRRETCQLCTFCCDCNLEAPTMNMGQGSGLGVGLFQSFKTFPRLLNCVLELHQRNFWESENTVSPPDILTNEEWGHYVFVSTIRHPISRILSSLNNDPLYNNNNCQLSNQTSQEDQKPAISTCGHDVISSDRKILNSCRKEIYSCYSNYYVRMFAGTYKERVTPAILERAKQNFERYSCVILQEYWKETVGCLRHRLGLNLQQDGAAFNAGGSIQRAADSASTATTVSTSTPNITLSFLEKIDAIELERLTRLNSYDIEFYEWAKERILEDAKHKWDRRTLVQY
jgi:hypothetical protein